ncbi:hypothetical protein MKY84_13125 [Chryseomicrobium sp. FSL W7-1435]|uniref:hypothetical protein n=1 Tax=Chryseomicrobium sp. FSL W7-1435 TaxID=2921704 RepID=UPI00315AC355
MRVVTFLVGLIGLISAITYLFTQNDLYYTIFMITMPYIWGVTALNEWKEGRKVFSIFCMIVGVTSLLVLSDIVFDYL